MFIFIVIIVIPALSLQE